MSRATIPGYPLRPARVHEACGPAAASFAIRTAALMDGHVIWVRERWRPEHLNPLGFDGFDPARLLLAQTGGQTETLAIAEEALRASAVALTVIAISAPLSLTAGRRLQLAAAAGRCTGLCLIPEGMGSPAAETRWHCAPVFDLRDSTLQCWTLAKNKSGMTGSWHVRWHAQTRDVHVVPPDDLRPGAAEPAG